MERFDQLLKLASKLSTKYASIDANSIKDTVHNSIQNAIVNAATVRTSGVMSFIKMLDQDQASLAINITRHGRDVSVSDVSVTPPQLTSKYKPLSNQIQQYLEKYLEVFPTRINDEAVDYNDFTTTLQFPSADTFAVK